MEWAVATRLKVWRAHVVFGVDSVEDRKDKRAHNTQAYQSCIVYHH